MIQCLPDVKLLTILRDQTCQIFFSVLAIPVRVGRTYLNSDVNPGRSQSIEVIIVGSSGKKDKITFQFPRLTASRIATKLLHGQLVDSESQVLEVLSQLVETIIDGPRQEFRECLFSIAPQNILTQSPDFQNPFSKKHSFGIPFASTFGAFSLSVDLQLNFRSKIITSTSRQPPPVKDQINGSSERGMIKPCV